MASNFMIQSVRRFLPLLTSSLSSQQINVVRGKKLWMKPYLKSLYKRRLEQGPEPDRPRSFWINWNYEAELFSFAKRLGEDVSNDTLRIAFTTSSYITAQREERSHLEMTTQLLLADNTQLAKQGEDIARSYVRQFLLQHWSLLPEQGLNSVSSYLLSDDKLSYLAAQLGFKDLILTMEFPPSSTTMSQSFRAVIGAISKEHGVERANKFIEDFILTQLVGKNIQDVWNINNAMGLLTQQLNKLKRGPPEPRLIWSSASQTIMAVYMVAIYSDKQIVGKGSGETVLIAEEMAARDALLNLLQLSDSRPPLPFNNAVSQSLGTVHRSTHSDHST